MLNKVHIEYI